MPIYVVPLLDILILHFSAAKSNVCCSGHVSVDGRCC